MDVNTLMNLMTSASSTSAISQKTGASSDQVASVLSSMMPMLLNGATSQATNQSTAAGFASALNAHGAKDTRDLGAFLGGVDQADGAKILQHLLGGNSSASMAQTAAATGTSQTDVAKIMAMAAPLLMAILGQQMKKHGSGSQGLMSVLLSSALSGALGGKPAAKPGLGAGDVLGLLGSLMK